MALLILALFVLGWAELAAPGGGRYFPLTNFDLYANIMVISEVWLVVSIGILNIQPDGSPVSGFIGAVVAFPLAWNHFHQEAGFATIDDVNGWDLDWEVVAGPGIDVALVALFLLFVGSALASLAPYSPEPDSSYLVSPLAVKLGRIFTDHGLTARQYDSIVRMHQDLTAWSTADDETSQQATEALSEHARDTGPTSHEGAAAAGGRCAVVLGSGIDVVYPRSHRALHASVLETGGVVMSEFPPGTPPEGWRFPTRNSRNLLQVRLGDESTPNLVESDAMTP